MEGAYKRHFGRQGHAPGEFREVRGVAISPSDGNIIVTDIFVATGRVQIMRPDGTFVHMFGENSLVHPLGVSVSGGGDIVVVDSEGLQSISIYDSCGGFLRDVKMIGLHTFCWPMARVLW